MSTEFDALIGIRSQITTIQSQKGLEEKDPRTLVEEARAETSQYKIAWDAASAKGEPKPPNSLVGRAKRILRVFPPLLEALDLETERLVQTLAREYNIPQGLRTETAIAAGALLTADNFYPYYPTGSNPDRQLAIDRLSESVEQAGQVTLCMFSCPELDYVRLTDGEDPNYFIRENACRNTGVVGADTVRAIARNISASGLSTRLIVFLGDTDELDYVFPVLGNFGVNPAICETRMANYFASFQRQCAKEFRGVNLEVYRWSQFATPSELSTTDLPSLGYIDQEMERMGGAFVPEGYYAGLPRPTDTQLAAMVRLKMATYARQGVAIRSLFPQAIGLQNEFPAALRTLMLNAGLPPEERIPFIYPFDPGKRIY